MNAISQNSWLVRSGQGWKITGFFLLVLITGISGILFYWRINHQSAINLIPSSGILDSITIFSTIFALILLWSIRCPKCKRGVASYILRNESAGKWLTTLASLEECPLCKDKSL